MIVLKINGSNYKYFSNVNVNLSLDTIASQFSFGGFFNIDDNKLKEIFKPLSYNKCEVWAIDEDKGINERLITGTILNPALSQQRQIRLSGLSGYSKTGILEDVNIPIELYPLQFDGLGLDQIAQRICDFFGITLRINANAKEAAAKPFEKVKAQPETTIKSFLSGMARQRNITIAHDNFGRLLLYKILDIDKPEIKIDENDFGVISISTTPNAQAFHSSITVIRQSSKDNQNEGQTTVISPFVKGVNRPIVRTLSHGTGTDTKEAAEAIACAEAKNMPITIELEGWDFQNKIVRAGFYIEVNAPSIFISRTKLLLENVSFKADPEKGKTQTMTCVLPCVYTGKLPSKSPFR
jgi:prophage tail gpP-like protein